jgi:hypothetical protein
VRPPTRFLAAAFLALAFFMGHQWSKPEKTGNAKVFSRQLPVSTAVRVWL